MRLVPLIALSSSLAVACVRPQQVAKGERPDAALGGGDPSVCEKVEGFENLARAQKLELLATASESSEPWLIQWHVRFLTGFESARGLHAQSYRDNCARLYADTVKWNQALACLERGRIRLDAQIAVAAEVFETKQELLKRDSNSSWRLDRNFVRCGAPEEVSHSMPLAGAELEAQARAGLAKLGRAWAWAELGEYPKAETLVAALEGEVRVGGDARSVFELHLLRGWLALARNELRAAEAELAPAKALASKLGRGARIDLAFFRGSTATIAGDDEGAEHAFENAEKDASVLAKSAPLMRVEQGEAKLLRAQAQWRLGDKEAAQKGLGDAWALVDGVLRSDDPLRAEFEAAGDQLGISLSAGEATSGAPEVPTEPAPTGSGDEPV